MIRKLSIAAVSLGVLAVPSVAAADTIHYTSGNTYIRAYSGSHCNGTSSKVRPGHSKGHVKSVRVRHDYWGWHWWGTGGHVVEFGKCERLKSGHRDNISTEWKDEDGA